jgi:ribosome-associated toxin RatA of RatAB toxin-antitoxin module
MFDLVADVGSYPQFLTGCRHAVIHEQSSKHLIADLDVAWNVFAGKFRSWVSLTAPESIHIHYSEGPFKAMESWWTFKDVAFHLKRPQCQIEFKMHLKLESVVLESFASPVLDLLCKKMMKCFEDRARAIYPRKAGEMCGESSFSNVKSKD